MILTFDTSILIDLERGNPETIRAVKALVETHQSPAYLLFIPFFEFSYGLVQRSPKHADEARAFLNHFPFLSPSKQSAELLAVLKEKYDAQGIVLPLADLLIASQVQEHRLLLVTKDKDFSAIEEIDIAFLE